MKSGGSTKVMRSLFQEKEGGAVPTSPLKYRVGACRFSEIRHIFEEFHYKGGHMGGGISLCLALLDGYNIVGGVVVGKPRHEEKYKNCVEIRRMACKDSCPKNTESYFLSKTIWWIKKKKLAKTVLSYSDMSVGHKGTIYRAANFKLVGQTSPSVHIFWRGKRYHPRSLTIERPYSHELRKDLENGIATREVGLPKNIWIYET